MDFRALQLLAGFPAAPQDRDIPYPPLVVELEA
jgi:hypothetical protein